MAGSNIYVKHVIIPVQLHDAAVNDHPRGNLSDLYPRWLGARELLLYGHDPYSPEITREIQQGYYGRVLDPNRPGDPQDQAAFAYPVYVVFLIAPTIRMPFAQVQLIFANLLWIITAASVFLWFRVLRWRVSAVTALALALLTLGSLPVIQAIKLQQLTLLVAALLAGCFAAVAAGYLSLAGLLLALATIKPQLALLPVFWLLAWSIYRWRERWRMLAVFCAAMLALLFGAEAVLHGWIGKFFIAMRNYHAYTHNQSLLQVLSTPILGYGLAALLLLFVAWLCRPSLRTAAASPQFTATSSLVLALVVVTVPMFALYNQVLLLPAILVLARDWRLLWNGTRTAKLLIAVTAILLFWPWATSLVLDLALAVLPSTTVQNFWKLPFFSSDTMPVLVFGTLAYHLVQNPAIADKTASNLAQLNPANTLPPSRHR